MTKKKLPEKKFKELLWVSIFSDEFTVCDCTEFFLDFWFLTKDQVEFGISCLEKYETNNLKGTYLFKKNNLTELTFQSDCIDELIFGILLIENSLENFQITTEEAFSFYFRIIKMWVKYNDISLKNAEIMANTFLKNGNRKYPYIYTVEGTRIWEDDYYNDRLERITAFFRQKFSDKEEYRKIIENYIDENFNYFCQYVYSNSVESHEDQMYLVDCWKKYFNFSEEFIEKHIKNIKLPYLIKNVDNFYTNSQSKLNRCIRILESNINDIISTHSKAVNNDFIKLTDDQIEEYSLLLALNLNI